MGADKPSGEERRRAERLELELPIRGRVGDGDFHDLEVVDIGVGGMQIRSPDFESLKAGFDQGGKVARFEIHVTARLAWAQPGDDGTFLTGWEFDVNDGEVRMG